MKNIKEYITESHKTYSWKIGVAGDLPEGFDQHLQKTLEKWTVVSFSKGKKTPIQERPLDFPMLENIDVHYFDVEMRYPTTRETIREYISQCTNIASSHVIVRSPNEPQELYQEREENTEYETLLTKEDMGGESAQKDAGESRIMDLLKELEAARKERNDASSGFRMEATKEEPQNNKSIVGK